MTASRLQLHLLGPARLCLADEDISRRIKYRRAWALLGYLAAQPGLRHTREHLADLFWPNLNMRAALANLRQIISNLNRLPDAPPLLQADRDSVALLANAIAEIDLHLLGDYSAARLAVVEPRLSLLQRPFLDGMALPDAPAFEQWMLGMRQHFQTRSTALLHAVCETQRESGRLAAAVVTARLLWQQDLLAEPAAARLITLLMECGDTRGAQDVFRTLDQGLKHELGKSASRGLRKLLDASAAAIPGSAAQQPAQASHEYRWISFAHIEYQVPQAAEEEDAAEACVALIPVLAAAQESIRQWGGYALPASGLGFQAVFGMHASQEQSALRSVLAAESILRASPPEHALRIGLCAGKALLGINAECIEVLGKLPGIARHACGQAASERIVLNQALCEQLPPHFICQPLAQTTMESPASIPLYQLQAEQRAAPIQTATTSGPDLVARESELEALQQLWSQACTGAPQFVLLQGEAGIGKTRLAREFAQGLAQQGFQIRRMACALEYQHQPLAPIRQLLETLAGLAAEDTPAQRKARMLDFLASRYPAQAEPQRQALLHLLTPQAHLPAETGSSKDILFSTLCELLDQLCSQTPSLLVIDDLHWGDFTTRELLAHYARLLDRQRLLILVTTRPERAPDTAGAPASIINLGPLDAAAARRLATCHDPAGALSSTELDTIARRCGGIPLFIERLTRSHINGQSDTQPSIAELLSGELDRLGHFRLVLQAAAVIGQRFSTGTLAHLLPDAEIAAVLELAEASRLIERDSTEQRHTFRHALIRDAAYDSLPAAQKRGFHLELARLLQTQPDKPVSEIASHFEAARQWPEACHWWAHAGQAAMADEFASDAMHHFGHALSLQEARRQTPEPALRPLRLALGAAALLCQGYGSALGHQQFRRVVDNIEQQGDALGADREDLFKALSGLYMGASSQGENLGFDIARQLEHLADTPEKRLMACFALGNSLFWRGAFREALNYQEEGAHLSTQLGLRERTRYCHDDLGVLVRAFLCWNLWFVGQSTRARRVADEGIALARSSGQTHALCFILTFAAGMHFSADQATAAAGYSQEGLSLATRYGFPLWQGVNSLFLLWAQARNAQLHDTSPLLAAAAQMTEAYQAGTTTARWIVASSLICLEYHDEAETLVDRTLADAASYQDFYCIPDLLRLKGLCLSNRGATEAEARIYLDTARQLSLRHAACGMYERLAEPRR